MMNGKLLLDSANIDEIKRISHTSAVAGVTTNPSLMAKEGKGVYVEKLKEIAAELNAGGRFSENKHLSVEVTTTELTPMMVETEMLASELGRSNYKHVDLHIKVPITLDNLQLITAYEKRGISVNATACMIPSQAKLAMDAGASVVSFFYNRMRDGGDHEPELAVAEFSSMREEDVGSFTLTSSLVTNKKKKCKIICGSIRRPQDVFECWNAGADYVTAPLHIIEKLLEHPQTTFAIERFQEDIDRWLA